MAHLARTRLGWENEHAASFLLSGISFVSRPLTVADDVGVDFFCVLFQKKAGHGGGQLFPLSSFAVQVKSSKNPADVSKSIAYLEKLEVPYFVAILTRKPLSLAIYSGEGLPMLLSHVGTPKKLKLEFVADCSFESEDYFVRHAPDHFTLKMPLVCTLTGQQSDVEIREIAIKLHRRCSRMHYNISSRAKHEYVFRLNDVDPQAQAIRVKLFSGPTSIKWFRENLGLRLAEAFCNFEWILKKGLRFDAREFRVYEQFYEGLQSIGLVNEGVRSRYLGALYHFKRRSAGG